MKNHLAKIREIAARGTVRTVRFCKYAAGVEDGAQPGSNIRRFLSRLTFVAFLGLAAELVIPAFTFDMNRIQLASARIAVLWSFCYFALVVLIPVLVLSNRDFRIRPSRLFSDIIISGGYSILAFGLLYRKIGYAESVDDMVLRTVADAYYFSAVTFSTLGFGDFRPTAAARGYAALQGIWGNIHLGLLAGAVFFSMSEQQQPPQEGPPNEDLR